MPKNTNIETLYSSGSWHDRIGKHYLSSFGWILAVIAFAYLPILVEIGVNAESTFFSAYAKQQASYWAVLGNASFFAFAIGEYIQARKKDFQWWIGLLWAIAALCLAFIPNAIIWYSNSGECLLFHGKRIAICCPAYFMHVFFLATLYVTKAEMRKCVIYKSQLNKKNE